MDISYSKPQKCAVKVPSGRVLVNRRWARSVVGDILTSSTSGCNAVLSDGLGYVDFFPSDSCPVIYVTEAELLTPRSFKERIQSLSKDYNQRGVIIVDESKTDSYQELQEMACLELGLTVFPISIQNEIPRILQALTSAETKMNPFRPSPAAEQDLEKQQIALLRLVPSIGEKTAVRLLKLYGHITAISKLSEERLATKIGRADAQKVYGYFRNKIVI